jgi:hypothetical protein
LSRRSKREVMLVWFFFVSTRIKRRRNPSPAARPDLAKIDRGSPPTTTQHSTPARRKKTSAATWPSAVGMGCSGVSPDYDNPSCAHAEESQAERCGQAERSEAGVFGVLPRLRLSNLRARGRRPSRAQRPGRARRSRGVRVSPPTAAIQLACTPKKAKPSTAARPSAAE